jgi:hypothetical protein
MVSPVTRAETVMHRVGVARGNLAFLGQHDASRMGAILHRFASQYRVTPNGMTRARSLAHASVEDSGATLVASLNALTRDASFIRGFTPLNARRVNPHLRILAAECEAFALAQSVSADVDQACSQFLEVGMGSGSYAGSALVR